MKVIDSSVLVKYFSREPDWERAEQAILDVVVTLPLAVKEVANALWKKVLRGELGPRRIVSDLASGAIPLHSQEPLTARALELALEAKEARITVYDALFIALAERLDAPLVTANRRQAEAARRLGIEVELVA